MVGRQHRGAALDPGLEGAGTEEVLQHFLQREGS